MHNNMQKQGFLLPLVFFKLHKEFLENHVSIALKPEMSNERDFKSHAKLHVVNGLKNKWRDKERPGQGHSTWRAAASVAIPTGLGRQGFFFPQRQRVHMYIHR